MKEQQHDKKQETNKPKSRGDIRNSDIFKEDKGPGTDNQPGEDRVAKTERKGSGQQQDSGGHPINS